MKTLVRRRGPTIALAALMFVVGGATVTTAHGLITSGDIKDGAVKTVDLGNGAVNSAKVADGQVKSADLANGGVGNADLANNAVGSGKISDGQVKSADLANGGVANADLAANAVNSAKIANGGVANADLAANSVGSGIISDGQVKSADIANGGVANADLAANAVNSAKIADGSIAIGDISAAAQDELTGFSGPNWGVMDRNVLNNGDAYLRAGPSHAPIPPAPEPQAPPFGVGSLGIRTGAGNTDPSGGDKAAFGNEVDFANTLVSDLTAVSFFVYTTTENITIDPANLPNIAIEISANLDAVPGPVDFSTMVYSPPAQLPAIWRQHDAVADPDAHWRLTGAEGDEIGCNQVTACTFADLIAGLTADDATDLEPAVIGTVGISKGRDHIFSGAVDALQINGTVYDFEPNGVFETPAAP